MGFFFFVLFRIFDVSKYVLCKYRKNNLKKGTSGSKTHHWQTSYSDTCFFFFSSFFQQGRSETSKGRKAHENLIYYEWMMSKRFLACISRWLAWCSNPNMTWKYHGSVRSKVRLIKYVCALFILMFSPVRGSAHANGGENQSGVWTNFFCATVEQIENFHYYN